MLFRSFRGALEDGEGEPDLAALPWRVGRHVGRTIYAGDGEPRSDSERLIGMMDTPELAAEVVHFAGAAGFMVSRSARKAARSRATSASGPDNLKNQVAP